MGSLSERDAALVLRAATEMMNVDSDAEFATSVLAVVHSVIPCDVVSYNELDLSTGSTHVAVFPQHWTSEVARSGAVFERVVHDNPIAAHVRATGCRTAVRLEDVISDDDLFENAFYVDFLHGILGLRHQLAIALPSPSWLVFAVASSRGPGDRFTDREVTLLDALGPHIVHSYRRAELERARSSLAQAASEEGWAAVTVDEHGTVLRIDGDAGPDYETGHRVPEEVRHRLSEPHHESLLRAGSASTTPEVGDPTVRVHTTGGSDYFLLVRRGGGDLKTGLMGRGFTPRQADVAAQLLIGGTNDDIAQRLAISTGTVRKHLEALYRGLQVRDRSSAIARIASCAKVTGAV